MNDFMSWFYQAYGLNIYSEISCPFVNGNADQAIDVEIKLGQVPSHLQKPEYIAPWYAISNHELLLKFPTIANFYIESGERITIQIEHQNLTHVMVYLLGSAMCGLLLQRGLMILHANTVMVDNQGILIMAPPGTGKSTLTAAFLKKGFLLISDDLSALSIQNQQALAYPGYPQIKLCPDVFNYFDYTPQQLQQLPFEIRKIIKYYVRVPEQYHPEPCKITQLILLETTDTQQISGHELIQGYTKFKTLLNHAHFSLIYKTQKMEHRYFNQCAALSTLIPLQRLVRPRDQFSAFDLVDEIVAQTRNTKCQPISLTQ